MTSVRSLTLAGPLLVLVYCVINSSKSVLEAALVQHISPEFLAFNVFLLAQVFFLVVCRDKRGLLPLLRRLWPDIVGFNLSTAVSWVAVLYAFTVLEPAVANSVIIGLIPSITILLGRWMSPESAVLPLERVAAGGVLAAMFYLAAVALSGSTATGGTSIGGVVFGLLACVLTATAVAGNTYYTKRLAKTGMTIGQMMACRFVLLLVVTLGIVLVRHSGAEYTPRNVGCWY